MKGKDERWTEYYRVYECALAATKDAYMPNAQRKKEYLRIYDDVSKQNELLVRYLVSRHNATLTSDLLAATDNRTVNKASIAVNALGRWNSSRRMVRGRNHFGNVRIGASAGSDTDRFLGGIHVGYEHNYMLRSGWVVFWQVKSDLMIKGQDLFRTGVALGFKIPVK